MAQVLSTLLPPVEFEALRLRMCSYLESIMTAQFMCPPRFTRDACPHREMHREHPLDETLRSDHFGQIANVSEFGEVHITPGRSKPEPPIVTCSWAPRSSPFPMQPVAAASVDAGRLHHALPPLDRSVKDSFSPVSYSEGPIPYVSPPTDPTDTTGAASYEKYLVQLSTVQQSLMSHDPAHRTSCKRKGSQKSD
jgi:hypothetical protein